MDVRVLYDFSVLAVIYYLNGDAVDDLPISEKAGIGIFHEEVDVHVVVDELEHFANKSVGSI